MATSPGASVQVDPLMPQGSQAGHLATTPTLPHLCLEPAPTLPGQGQGQGLPEVASSISVEVGLALPTPQPGLEHVEKGPRRQGELTSPAQPSFCMYLRTMDQIWHLVSSWPPVAASKCS